MGGLPDEIPVRIVDLAEIVRGEFAENAFRKDFLPSEIDAIRRELEPVEKMAAKERMSEGGKVGKVSTPSGKTRDKIGEFAGMSGRNVEKIAAVVDAAQTDPEQYGHLVDEMDRTGKVDPAYRAVKRLRRGPEIPVINLRPGHYGAIIVAPPWEDGSWQLSSDGQLPPAEIDLRQLAGLDIGGLAADDSFVFLNVPNSHLPDGVRLLRRWGFKYLTPLTYEKSPVETSGPFDDSTGHVLCGVRGNPTVVSEAQPTILMSESQPNGGVPDGLYSVVRTVAAPPYGECFQRDARPDFDNLFISESRDSPSPEVVDLPNKEKPDPFNLRKFMEGKST